MNRFEKAAEFGSLMGSAAFKKTALTSHGGITNPVLSNALGYGLLGGLGGAAIGGLRGLILDKDKGKSSIRRALSGAAKAGLLGAAGGGLLGGGTAATQIYQPYTALKDFIKSRFNAVNELENRGDTRTFSELAKSHNIGEPIMVGKVPFTGGLLDTKKMHEAVNDNIRDAKDVSIDDFAWVIRRPLRFLGII